MRAQDCYVWPQEQAALLREGAWHDLDVPNLAEEIESLGKVIGERWAVICATWCSISCSGPTNLLADTPAGRQPYVRGGVVITLSSSRPESSSAPRARGISPQRLLSVAGACSMSRR